MNIDDLKKNLKILAELGDVTPMSGLIMYTEALDEAYQKAYSDVTNSPDKLEPELTVALTCISIK